MRLEANLSDERGSAVVQLADELGLSSSQLINEAVSLFLKAVLEVRQGRRLVAMDPKSDRPPTEVATPVLSALTWLHKPQALALPPAAIAKMKQLSHGAPQPSARLVAAARRGKP